MKKKQILAWIAIIALGGMYIADLILALIKSDAAATMLKISLFMTFIIPVIIWILLVLLGKTKWKEENLQESRLPRAVREEMAAKAAAEKERLREEMSGEACEDTPERLRSPDDQ